MSWGLGYDPRWQRDVGYGVPATCDHPGCTAEIDRGLAHVCGGEPFGGEHGCGLYFCVEHHSQGEPCNLCGQCAKNEAPFAPTQDLREWMMHKLTDQSWERWRIENPEPVERLKAACATPDKPSQPPSGVKP